MRIADHSPYGSAAANLAQRFGVVMGKGHVFDLANSDTNPTILVFSKDNRLLGSHAITRGRTEAENVKRIVAFKGQSLSVPADRKFKQPTLPDPTFPARTCYA